jgi:hypothetical protein
MPSTAITGSNIVGKNLPTQGVNGMVGESTVTPPSIRKDKKANLKQTLKLPKNFAKNKKTPVQRGGG